MKKHNITTSELMGGENSRSTSVKGFLAKIEPPIELNPEAVRRTVANCSLRGLGVPKPDPSADPFEDALLLGSTKEATVIYARLREPIEYTDRQDRRTATVFSHNMLSSSVCALIELCGAEVEKLKIDEGPPIVLPSVLGP